jgi:hypothetical protein
MEILGGACCLILMTLAMIWLIGPVGWNDPNQPRDRTKF